ncbi:SpoIID/LytB domain-containing protein [Ammoniphilus sp. YIM 78166]|uniref:SpoIID/LytB domain-containing protein n=1 Tax=Ammoniphilus sp. YIM 78166 TaxID=1644106 RepID=UPI00106F498F|nr:SpoIID/LytB domain-containing protein [Ammoniphilus sp. YIM 78166]
MRTLLLILTLTAFCFTPQLSSAEELVSIRLANYIGETRELDVYLTGNYLSTDPSIRLIEGVKYHLTSQQDSLRLEGNGIIQEFKTPLVLYPEQYDTHHVIRINRRPYLGAMEFRLVDTGPIQPVNHIPLEDYLKGVVPYEVYPTWGLETLKAQALAARTYAAAHAKKEMDDTISYQVYGGYTWYPQTTKAVEETRGEVITYRNRLIEAFYSASNGGMTESNAHVWGGNSISYYPIKRDPFDPVHPWEFELEQLQISLEEIDWDQTDWWESIVEKDENITATMKKWLYRKGYLGDLKILSIPRFELSEHRYASQRATKGSIEIEFLRRLLDGTVLFETVSLTDVPLSHIRPLIGGNRFKSYLIDSLTLDKGTYSMKGKGYGHGVGMSQWGAHYMGLQGKTYRDILQFYFPGTQITSMSLP